MRFRAIDQVLPGFDVRLTHSEKKAGRFIERMAGKDERRSWEGNKAADAITSCIEERDTGEMIYLVFMRPCLDRSAARDAALLAHEATHVAISYLGSIGESEPSEELFAYTVQAVTCYLVEAHFSWKKKRLSDSR